MNDPNPAVTDSVIVERQKAELIAQVAEAKRVVAELERLLQSGELKPEQYRHVEAAVSRMFESLSDNDIVLKPWHSGM